MKYCSACGHFLVEYIPKNDHLVRHVCDHCGTIHYQNPLVVTGCIPIDGDRVLLCKRAIEPHAGKWTLPAGFLENGESVMQGAVRELKEEACAQAIDAQFYAMYDLPHIHQVHIFYRCHLDINYGVNPGIESTDVQWFRLQEIPWNELAFQSVRQALIDYSADRDQQSFSVHTHCISH